MVRVLTVDDTNKPKEIPQDKWLVKDEEYRVLGIYIHPNQGDIQGITLLEKPLDETCRPYGTFNINRFAFHLDDLEELMQLARDCTDLREMGEQELEQLLKKEIHELIENE